MASKKQRRNAKKKAARKRGDEARTSGRLQAPKKRLKSLFRVFDDISAHTDHILRELPAPVEHLTMFDAGVLMRALNTLKSIRILLEQAHWELASAGARQLFELLVNIEYLTRMPDRDEAGRRYVAFGILQLARQQLAEMEYAERTGRTIDGDRKAGIEAMLDNAFAEFRTKDGGWAKSWSGRPVRQLAEASSKPLRAEQYQLLFGPWSEQVHASPGALIDGILGPIGLTAERIIKDDDRQIVEVASISITFFIEIWTELPNILPLPAEVATDWMGKIVAAAREQGAAIPGPASTVRGSHL
jgi:hypothetical protein